jgi:WD40 repeat protein/energy-coupling factor transporter ATP-binding protein EcfA2
MVGVEVLVARVFVSHANEDQECAGRLHQWLVAKGHEVFLDQDLRDGIVVGEGWEQRLHERLRWAGAVVCVVTSAAVESRWCWTEVGIALSRGSRVLPVRAESGVVHPLLTSVQYADLTVDPIAGREALVEALRRVDAVGGGGWPDGRSPFPGLRPLDVDEHQVFFGRTDEVAQLVELLRSPVEQAKGAALLIVGPSGCGKSSLVRAGLLPVMADEPGWQVLSPILPGVDPMAALAREMAAAARRIDLDWTVQYIRHRLDNGGLTGLVDELLLVDPGGPQRRLLIVVDQFEELLTQTTLAKRAGFAELLRPALTGPVQLVGTLRSEFLDQLLGDSALGTVVTTPHPLRPLQREALRLVIEEPTRLVGINVEDHLVARLVDDTDTGEALPLLAFTLAQLSKDIGRGGQLSTARYDQLGGVQGALTHQADAALAEATGAGGRNREEVIAGLLRLVTVDEQGRPTRWRARRSELPDSLVSGLNAFVARRLLTTDAENGAVVVGVAHEAFLSAWPPLAQAIAANVLALRARRTVEHAATEWHKTGRLRERLWSGGQLAAAVTDTGARICAASMPAPVRQGSSRLLPRRCRVLVTDRVEVSPTARDFLHASIRRDRYRRRRATTVLSALLIFALVGAGVAIVQQRAAQEQQQIATARQLITQADAIRETDPRTGLLLGIAAEHIRPGGETQASLVNTLTTTRYAGTLTDHTGPVTSVTFSPDGHALAVGDSGGLAIWRDLADLTGPKESLTAHAGLVFSVAFSPDGRTLATGSFDGRVILWDLADATRPQKSLTARASSVFSVAFSPDGRTLATGDSEGTVILRDLGDPTHSWRSLAGHTSAVNSVAFAPDGRTLATASDDGTAILWDLTNVTLPQRLGSALTSHTSRVTTVAFAPNGRTLATGDSDGRAILWDLTNVTLPQRLGSALTSHTSRVTTVAFAPNGRTLATASSDGTVILWNFTARVQPRRLGQPLTGQPSPVDSVMFSPDGRTLATTSSDGTVILRDLSDPNRPRFKQSWPRASNLVDSLALAPDGKTMVTVSDDGSVILWDLTDRAQPRPLGQPLTSHRSLVTAAAFSGNGRTLATGSDDGSVILWDLTDRAQPRPLGQPLTGHAGSVTSVALGPDGSILATGGSDATVILWDLTDLNQLRDHATEYACSITGRGLDRAEWVRYIPGLPYQDTCRLLTARGDGS